MTPQPQCEQQQHDEPCEDVHLHSPPTVGSAGVDSPAVASVVVVGATADSVVEAPMVDSVVEAPMVARAATETKPMKANDTKAKAATLFASGVLVDASGSVVIAK